MAKRKYDSSSSGISDSDTESDDYTEQPKKKTRKSNPKPKLPSTKAEVTIRATDTPLDKLDSQQRLEKIDSAVIGRIKKALALASHEQTGEDEAKAALRMASKLLERHNVTQADIMSQETEAEQLKRRCWDIVVVVSIRSTSTPPANVNIESWTNMLSKSMETFFDCQSYTTRFGRSSPKVDWSFYGLAEQTVAAAHAFEMTYNLISAWSLKPHIGKGVHAKNCYRTGVARGLIRMATKEKEDDKSRVVKKERALLKARQDQEAEEEKSRLNRLKGPEMEKTVGPPEVKAEVFEAEVKQEPDRRVKMEEVEDEEFITHPPLDQPDWMQTRTGNQLADDMEDELQGFGYAAPDFNDSDDENLLDLDAATPRLKKSASAGPSLGSMAPPPMKEEPDDTPWSSVGQLVAFREQSVAIGNDYLKTQGIKLKAGGKRKALEFKDREAQRLYKLGQEDAEKIDVRQKRLIKDVEMDE